MPVAQEFTVYLEDRAGTLGKICRKLADHGVNILALHSFPSGGKSVTRFIVDNPEAAKSALDGERLTLTVSDVLLLKVQNRPGEIARVAARLGEADIGPRASATSRNAFWASSAIAFTTARRDTDSECA